MDMTSFPILQPQNFKGVDLSLVYAPSGNRGAAQLQAVLATSFQGPMHVHAIPYTFLQQQTMSKPLNPAGLSTPGGVSIG